MPLKLLIGLFFIYLSDKSFADMVNPGVIGGIKENQTLSEEAPTDPYGTISLPLFFSEPNLLEDEKLSKWCEEISRRINKNSEEEMELQRALTDLKMLSEEGELTQADFAKQGAMLQLRKEQLALKKKKVLEDIKKVEIAQNKSIQSKKHTNSSDLEERPFTLLNDNIIQEINEDSEEGMELQRNLLEIDIQEKTSQISSEAAKNKRNELKKRTKELVAKQKKLWSNLEERPFLIQKKDSNIEEIEKLNKDPLKETSLENILKTHPVEKISLEESLQNISPSLEEIEKSSSSFQEDFKTVIKD